MTQQWVCQWQSTRQISPCFFSIMHHWPASNTSCFAKLLAATQPLRWDRLKDNIFVWALTLPTFTHPRPNTLPPFQQAQALGEQPPFRGHEQYPLRTQPDRIPVAARLGPPARNIPPRPFEQHTSHDHTGSEICHRYNAGKCTRDDQCKFSHRCRIPGCKAAAFLSPSRRPSWISGQMCEHTLRCVSTWASK